MYPPTRLLALCFFTFPLLYFPGPTFSQSCSPDLFSSFGGECYSVALDGNFAFVSEGFALTILDISDSTDPKVIGRVDVSFPIYDLDVSGTLAVVVGGSVNPTLASINVANKANPILDATLELPHYASDVSLDGAKGCLALESFGVQMLNLSEPSAPQLGPIRDTDGQPRDVVLRDDLVYVADSFANILILDASNPESLSVEGHLNLPLGDSPAFVSLEGNRLSVLDYSMNIHLVDVADPKSPDITGSLPLSGFPSAFAASGDRAVAANFQHVLFIADLSNPSVPVLSATQTLVSEPKAFAVEGDLAAFAVTHANNVVDGEGFNGVSFVQFDSGKGILPQSEYRTPHYPGFVRTIGDLLFVVDEVAFSRWVVHIADASRPRLPYTIGTLEVPDEPYEIRKSGDIVYIGSYEAGILVVDISDPSFPSEVQLVDTPAQVNDLEIQGDRMYVAGGEAGVQVYDISNPLDPSPLGSWPEPPISDYAEVVVPDNMLLYVSDGAGLHVLDVSDPTGITVVGSEPTFPRVFDLAVDFETDLVYGALYEGQLQIADVSNPAAPILRGSYEANALKTSQSVDLANGKVFVAVSAGGLAIFEAADVDNPLPCGGSDRTGERLFSTLLGTTIYLSGISKGVQIFGLSCGNSPDVNGDLSVDAMDLMQIFFKFLHPGGFPAVEDLTCDGIVDEDDFYRFQLDWKRLFSIP